VAQEANNADYQGTLGAALYRMGDLEATIPVLVESIRLRKPEDSLCSYCLYYLAMAEWRLGRHENARESFKQAETLAGALPDSEKQHVVQLALLDELPQVAGVFGMTHRCTDLHELFDSPLDLIVENPPVGHNDHGVECFVTAPLNTNELVRQPGDRVGLTAARRMLDQVTLAILLKNPFGI
jgi:tetratricopeptide (TPR) repeat protein